MPQQGQTYLMLRLMDFLLPPLVVPSTGKRLALILSSPKIGQRRYRPAILGVLLDMQAVSLGSGLKFLVVIVYG